MREKIHIKRKKLKIQEYTAELQDTMDISPSSTNCYTKNCMLQIWWRCQRRKNNNNSQWKFEQLSLSASKCFSALSLTSHKTAWPRQALADSVTISPIWASDVLSSATLQSQDLNVTVIWRETTRDEQT